MTSGTKNNSMTSFYLFQDYDVILPMTPYTPLHPDDVTILFLDYDVIIFDDVNLYGIVTSLCPCVPVGEPLIYYYCCTRNRALEDAKQLI